MKNKREKTTRRASGVEVRRKFLFLNEELQEGRMFLSVSSLRLEFVEMAFHELLGDEGSLREECAFFSPRISRYFDVC